MSPTYEVTQNAHPEFPDLTTYTLSSPSNVTVTFIPGAGMVGSSLTHEGEELLGMRAGLAAYRESGKTFGIPLLAPWANRLAVREFNGIELVTEGTPGVHLDANGLPIHGLLAGCPDWRITRAEVGGEGDDEGAWLVADLDFNASRPEFPAFPFPHLITVAVHLVDAKVEIWTSVTATGELEVPIAFGWHPYFAPPGGNRADWTGSKPFTHKLKLNSEFVPTGEVKRGPVEVNPLGDPADGGIVLDDLYSDVVAGTTAWIEGGNRRITLSYDFGYDYAVLYAPADQALVAIEPMSAPTDPLAGHFPIKTALPGQTYTARYGIHVTPEGVSA